MLDVQHFPASGERRLLVTADVMALLGALPRACVDAILTDPPYGTSTGPNSSGPTPKLRGFRGGQAHAFDVSWDRELLLHWLDEARRVLRPGGAIVVFTDAVRVTDVWRALVAAGLSPKRLIAWDKSNPPPCPRKNFQSGFELGIFARKPGRVLCWNGGATTRNVLSHPIPGGGGRRERWHETQKPTALFYELVRLLVPPDGLAVDPFTGGGTTGVACYLHGCRFLGGDNDEKQVARARRRLARYDARGAQAMDDDYQPLEQPPAPVRDQLELMPGV